MDLLSKYEEMTKSAEAEVEEQGTEKTAEEEILSKYAELADSALAEEYGEDYTAEDVQKLAELMIDHDLYQAELEEEMETKVAEYAQAGTIMAKAFKAELNRE